MHGQKILLLLDNAPDHADVELNNVHIHFLPKNTTSRLQPMDAGIIRNFKLKYKKLFVRWVIEQTGPQKRLDLLTSTKFVVDAWGAVSEATICHCWRHTRIVSGSMSSRVERDSDPDRKTDLGDLEQLISRLDLVDALSAASYIAVEDAVEDSVDSDDSYEHSSSDSDCGGVEEKPFSHGEALEAAQKLQVYMFAHGLRDTSVQNVVDATRRMAITSKRQTSITSYFQAE